MKADDPARGIMEEEYDRGDTSNTTLDTDASGLSAADEESLLTRAGDPARKDTDEDHRSWGDALHTWTTAASDTSGTDASGSSATDERGEPPRPSGGGADGDGDGGDSYREFLSILRSSEATAKDRGGNAVAARGSGPRGKDRNATVTRESVDSTMRVAPEEGGSCASFEADRKLRDPAPPVGNVVRPRRFVTTPMADEGGLKEIGRNPLSTRGLVVLDLDAATKNEKMFCPESYFARLHQERLRERRQRQEARVVFSKSIVSRLGEGLPPDSHSTSRDKEQEQKVTRKHATLNRSLSDDDLLRRQIQLAEEARLELKEATIEAERKAREAIAALEQERIAVKARLEEACSRAKQEAIRLERVRAHEEKQREWAELNRDYPMPDYLKDYATGVKSDVNEDATADRFFNIGLTGGSGTGKSSLIANILSNFGANPGETPHVSFEADGTTEPIPYVVPGLNEKVRLWDLPGQGTDSFPSKSYLRDMGLKYFDALLVATDGRWKCDDSMLVDAIRSAGIWFSVVRTKADLVVESGRYDHGMSQEEALEQARATLQEQLVGVTVRGMIHLVTTRSKFWTGHGGAPFGLVSTLCDELREILGECAASSSLADRRPPSSDSPAASRGRSSSLPLPPEAGLSAANLSAANLSAATRASREGEKSISFRDPVQGWDADLPHTESEDDDDDAEPRDETRREGGDEHDDDGDNGDEGDDDDSGDDEATPKLEDNRGISSLARRHSSDGAPSGRWGKGCFIKTQAEMEAAAAEAEAETAVAATALLAELDKEEVTTKATNEDGRDESSALVRMHSSDSARHRGQLVGEPQTGCNVEDVDDNGDVDARELTTENPLTDEPRRHDEDGDDDDNVNDYDDDDDDDYCKPVPLTYEDVLKDMPRLGTNSNCDSKGRCIRHPHIRMRKKKFLRGWKTLVAVCPDCCMEELMRLKSSDRDENSGGGGRAASAFSRGGRGSGDMAATCSTANSSFGSNLSSLAPSSDTDRNSTRTGRGAGGRGGLAARPNSMPTPDDRYTAAILSHVRADGGDGDRPGPDVTRERPGGPRPDVSARRMGRGSAGRHGGYAARSNGVPAADGHASQSMTDVWANADGGDWGTPWRDVAPAIFVSSGRAGRGSAGRRSSFAARSNSMPTEDRHASESHPEIHVEADGSNDGHARTDLLPEDSDGPGPNSPRRSRGAKKGNDLAARPNSVPTPDRHASKSLPNVHAEKPRSVKKQEKKKKKKVRDDVGGGRTPRRNAAPRPRYRASASMPTPDRHAPASPAYVRLDESEDRGTTERRGRRVRGVDFADVDAGRRSGAVDRAVREAESRGRRRPRGGTGRRVARM